MFKIGQKASHFMTTHKVGTIKNIEYARNNFMTTGGTTASKVFVILEYKDGTIAKHDVGDLIKVYD